MIDCKYCDSQNTKVIDTRKTKRGTRRRRECLDCGWKFSTLELLVEGFKEPDHRTVLRRSGIDDRRIWVERRVK